MKYIVLFFITISCQTWNDAPQSILADTVQIVRIDTLIITLHDTLNTLKDIDSTEFFDFKQNFHDSILYKAYAIVYSDTFFRNKSSTNENFKTRFIKWRNVIFEVYE